MTKFSPSAKQAFSVIKILAFYPMCKNKPLPPPMLAYESNKNLKSFLVPSKLPPSLDCIHKTDLPSIIQLEYTPVQEQ